MPTTWTNISNTQASDTDNFDKMINTGSIGQVTILPYPGSTANLKASPDIVGITAPELQVLIPNIFYIARASDSNNHSAIYNPSAEEWTYNGDFAEGYEINTEEIYQVALLQYSVAPVGTDSIVTSLFYYGPETNVFTTWSDIDNTRTHGGIGTPTSFTNVHNTYAWTVASGLPVVTLSEDADPDEIYVYTVESGVSSAVGTTIASLKTNHISDLRIVAESDNSDNNAVFAVGSWTYNGTFSAGYVFQEGVAYQLTLVGGSSDTTTNLFYSSVDLAVSWSNIGNTLVRTQPPEVDLSNTVTNNLYAKSSIVGYTMSQLSAEIPNILHIYETNDQSTGAVYVVALSTWVSDTIGNIESGVLYSIQMASGTTDTVDIFYNSTDVLPTTWSDISNTQASITNSWTDIANTQASDTDAWSKISNTQANDTDSWSDIANTQASTTDNWTLIANTQASTTDVWTNIDDTLTGGGISSPDVWIGDNTIWNGILLNTWNAEIRNWEDIG